MPIVFISLNEKFVELVKKQGYDGFVMKIEDHNLDPQKKTYYVYPTNCLCFVNGEINYSLGEIFFPNIEKNINTILLRLNIKNLLDKCYLPIGSSVIIDKCDKNGFLNKSLVISPTMLLQQDVSNTQNAYYSTIAALYNILINRKEDINNVDIIFASLCCSYGKMKEETLVEQIMRGINDYADYQPVIINSNIIVNEPNLHEQPKYYQNTEWLDINSEEITQ